MLVLFATLRAMAADFPPRGVDADGRTLGIWVGRPEGTELFAQRSDRVFPAASAIKTALVIELFAEHAGHLDEPPPGLAALLADRTQPPWAPFSASELAQVRAGLAGVTVRELGRLAIRVRPDVSNLVYNAASNASIALLGGPEAVSARIAARGFADIHLRRYMWAERDEGDNEATPRALAAVLGAVAASRVPGLDADTIEALRGILRVGPRRFAKGGQLHTHPLTYVAAGWEQSDPPLIVVVMGERRRPRERSDEAFQALEDAVRQASDAAWVEFGRHP